MSRRYYVLVGLEAPGHFGDPDPAEQKKVAARLVESLLRDVCADWGKHAVVTGTIGFSPDDVDRMVLALRDDTQKLAAVWREQREIIDRKLAELSAAVDCVVALREEIP